MGSAVKLRDVFEETTGIAPQGHAPPITNNHPAINVVPSNLEQLLQLQMPALLQAAITLERMKVEARRLDGRIIGTGEADFTKGNTLYTLNYQGKVFQLIDVPGIEGDESKYAHMVREAVAKAHLVFYINGTNKKPEKATAEKIRSYLRRGTQVCPIVNVRGNADAYEFEEDRKLLESQGCAVMALTQTMDVLASVLDNDALRPGHCVQGLLAFSSLAIHPESRETSIHPSRDKDLLIQQRNYFRYFTSARAMFEFSQIGAVAQVLHDKFDTFREDIIESNKVKVRELLTENIDLLKQALKEHEVFIDRVKPEFEKCRESINGAVQTFERRMAAGRKNLWEEFFNGLSEKSDEIVAEHFGDKDFIKEKLKKIFQARKKGMEKRLQEQFTEQLNALQTRLSQALERLIQDIRRVEFQQQIAFDDGNREAVYHTAQLDMELGLKDWGSIVFNVGSYAVTGAAIGSALPVIGTALGAVIGAAIGFLVSVMHLFTSKEKRIRKAQAQVQEKIDEEREKVIDRLPGEIKNLMNQIREEVREKTTRQVDDLYTSLTRPLSIIQQQIALMDHIKNQLERMPHGTIQAIQH